MLLHLIWLLPALIFTLSVLSDSRRLINAYLLSFTLITFLVVSSGFLVVGVERVSQQSALMIVIGFLLLIPISTILSTLYLIFNGRQMMRFEGMRLANLLSLLYGLALIIAFFLSFISPLVLFLNTLLFYGTYFYLSYILYGLFYNSLPIIKKPDYIIVLGSGLINDKVPPLLAQRLEKGKTIYKKFEQAPKIVVSGGQGSDEKNSEAEAMARYLIEHDIPQTDIIIENKSTTTFENLSFTKSVLDEREKSAFEAQARLENVKLANVSQESLGVKNNSAIAFENLNQAKSILGKKEKKTYRSIIVTNSFHSLRAGIYMRRVGLKGRSIGSRTAFYYLPSAWIRETLALFKMYWKIHAIILGPDIILWIIALINQK